MFDLRTVLWIIIAALFFILALSGREINKKIMGEIDELENIHDADGNIVGTRDFTGLSTHKLLGDSIIKVSTIGSIGCVISVFASILSIVT